MTTTDLAIPLCFFCGLSLTKPKGRGPDNMVDHHISYDPECKVRAHVYCHSYFHSKLRSNGYRFVERWFDQKTFRKRFINRMTTGYGDGRTPRLRFPVSLSDELFLRDVGRFMIKDQYRRQELRDNYSSRVYWMVKALGLGPQSTQEDFDNIVKLVRRHNGILTTEHDQRYAIDIGYNAVNEYIKRTYPNRKNIEVSYELLGH